MSGQKKHEINLLNIAFCLIAIKKAISEIANQTKDKTGLICI